MPGPVMDTDPRDISKAESGGATTPICALPLSLNGASRQLHQPFSSDSGYPTGDVYP